MKRSFALWLIAGVFVIFSMTTSCNKGSDIDESETPVFLDTCRPIRMTISEGPDNIITDTADFIYENGRIVRVNYKDHYKTLVYKDSLVTRVNVHLYNGPEVIYYQDIIYNSSGRIDSTVSSGINPLESVYPMYGYAFFYNTDGTPRRIEKYEFRYTSFESYYSWDYTYLEQNIPEVKVNNEGSIFDLRFTYDTIPNYFRKLPPEFVFADDYYYSFTSPYQMKAMPHFFTKNNITSLEGVPITYKTDSTGYMTEYNNGGFAKAKFIYECP